jgi:hypothetical protein
MDTARALNPDRSSHISPFFPSFFVLPLYQRSQMGRLLPCGVCVMSSMHRFTAEKLELTHLVTRRNWRNVLEEIRTLCYALLSQYGFLRALIFLSQYFHKSGCHSNPPPLRLHCLALALCRERVATTYSLVWTVSWSGIRRKWSGPSEGWRKARNACHVRRLLEPCTSRMDVRSVVASEPLSSLQSTHRVPCCVSLSFVAS